MSDRARRAYYEHEIKRLRAELVMRDAAIDAAAEARSGAPAFRLFAPSLLEDPIYLMMIEELEARRDGRA